MLVSPVNGVIIKLPFYSQWFAEHFNGVSRCHSKFPVHSFCGFGIRFLDRTQQEQYNQFRESAKTVLGITAAVYLFKKLFID